MNSPLKMLVWLILLGSSPCIAQDAIVISPPQYLEGQEAFLTYLTDEIQYPEQAKSAKKEATVRIKMLIDENGELKTIMPRQQYGFGFEEEAIRVLSKIEKWKPAMKQGRPVATYYTVGVPFKLSKEVKYANRVVFDKGPQFPGGNGALREFIIDNLEYPGGDKSGVVVLALKILTDGSIGEHKVQRTIGPQYTAAAVSTINQMPEWEAGTGNGKSRDMWITVPFAFAADESQRESRTVVVKPTYDGKTLKEPVKIRTTKIDRQPIKIADKNEKIQGSNWVDAAFPGGEEAFAKYIKENLEYPSVAERYNKEADLKVRFKVTKDGKVKEIQFQTQAGWGMEKEALRVLKAMPNWIPAKRNGQPYEDKVNVTIPFRLN